MIQLNLLPDVKQEFIKTRRQRRTIGIITSAAAAGALGLTAFMFLTSNVWQSRHINSLDEDIAAVREKIESTDNLTKTLTVQTQLDSLGDLHLKKTATSRLFEYIEAVVPSGVSVSTFEMAHASGTLTITGRSPTYELVNKLVDTMKFTDYSDASAGEGEPVKARAFSETVIQSSSTSDEGVSYTITASFDPILYDNRLTDDQIALEVPNITTTRSTTERPGVLFDTPEEEAQ